MDARADTGEGLTGQGGEAGATREPPATERIGTQPGQGDNHSRAMTPRLPIPERAIAEFCRKWKVAEF